MKSLSILSAICLTLSPFIYADNVYEGHRASAISSAGSPWNASRHLELVEKAIVLRAQILEQGQKKTFPISEDDLSQIYHSKTVPFFAYSSMIDKESGACKAISAEALATQTPALAFGIQRAFNREMPAATVEGGWGPLKRPNDLAILNVFPKEDAVLNGVVFDLPLSDLLILTKREVGYDLIPILAMRFSDALEEKEPEIFLAYTFQAPDSVRYTNEHVNPIPGYFNFLQKGLNVLGEDFTAMWWNSTYLADKKTLVRELPYQEIDLK